MLCLWWESLYLLGQSSYCNGLLVAEWAGTFSHHPSVLSYDRSYGLDRHSSLATYWMHLIICHYISAAWSQLHGAHTDGSPWILAQAKRLLQLWCPLTHLKSRVRPKLELWANISGMCAIVLPIDIENPYRLSNCLYRYISIYIGFLATNF